MTVASSEFMRTEKIDFLMEAFMWVQKSDTRVSERTKREWLKWADHRIDFLEREWKRSFRSTLPASESAPLPPEG